MRLSPVQFAVALVPLETHYCLSPTYVPHPPLYALGTVSVMCFILSRNCFHRPNKSVRRVALRLIIFVAPTYDIGYLLTRETPSSRGFERRGERGLGRLGLGVLQLEYILNRMNEAPFPLVRQPPLGRSLRGYPCLAHAQGDLPWVCPTACLFGFAQVGS